MVGVPSTWNRYARRGRLTDNFIHCKDNFSKPALQDVGHLAGKRSSKVRLNSGVASRFVREFPSPCGEVIKQRCSSFSLLMALADSGFRPLAGKWSTKVVERWVTSDLARTKFPSPCGEVIKQRTKQCRPGIYRPSLWCFRPLAGKWWSKVGSLRRTSPLIPRLTEISNFQGVSSKIILKDS